MKKILFCLILSFICISSYGEGKDTEISKQIPVVPFPVRDNDNSSKRGPRIPARIPISVFLIGDCITITCEYETLGSVEVYDNYTGSTVASDCGELSAGLSLILDDYHEGSMEIQITTDTKTYYGYF